VILPTFRELRTAEVHSGSPLPRSDSTTLVGYAVTLGARLTYPLTVEVDEAMVTLLLHSDHLPTSILASAAPAQWSVGEFAEGHAVDHDVKEAPDDEPEQTGRDDDHKSLSWSPRSEAPPAQRSTPDHRPLPLTAGPSIFDLLSESALATTHQASRHEPAGY
jgi:hypothetical protein